VSTVVVKMGGHALDDLSASNECLRALADDIATLSAKGDQVIVVHGGGPQINALLSAVGVHSEFVDGLRVTDEAAMTYVDMALASVNRALVTAFGLSGVTSVGVSGVDGVTLRADSIGSPWGHVAGMPTVTTELLETLLAASMVPVVSPVAVAWDGRRLNCNADTAAGAIAAAMDADVLVLLSDIDQLRADPEDPTTGLSRVSVSHVGDMIASGAAREGMRPKLAAAAHAIDAGARRVILANGTRAHALREVLEGTIATTEVTA